MLVDLLAPFSSGDPTVIEHQVEIPEPCNYLSWMNDDGSIDHYAIEQYSRKREDDLLETAIRYRREI